MNPAAEGTRYPEVAFHVDPERVAAFARAVGHGAPGVPPTFVTAAEFAVLPHVIGDPNLALDFSRVVHGSQEYVFERPLRMGETLTVRARIGSIRQKGANGFVTIAMELTDQDGRPVCTARSQMIERGEP
jgi:acyl dehydratase